MDAVAGESITLDDLRRRIRAAKEGRGAPVVVREIGEPRVRLYIGYNGGKNRRLLKNVCGDRTRPDWNRDWKCWLVARAHLDRLIEALCEDYGEVWLVRESTPRLRRAPRRVGERSAITASAFAKDETTGSTTGVAGRTLARPSRSAITGDGSRCGGFRRERERPLHHPP